MNCDWKLATVPDSQRRLQRRLGEEMTGRRVTVAPHNQKTQLQKIFGGQDFVESHSHYECLSKVNPK